MKPKTKVDTWSLIKMIQAEGSAADFAHEREIEAPLSQICESADALGPLFLKERRSFNEVVLSGEVFYSRFRPGDHVDIRTKKLNADQSQKFLEGLRVDSVRYPSPGKIEVILVGDALMKGDDFKEVFLFRSSSAFFSRILAHKVSEMSKSEMPILLGTGPRQKLSADGPKFKELYDDLNEAQTLAIHYLMDNDLNGAIQGPPGTGKTQLLRAIIALALHSDMKVCVASLTNAAVDNLLGRVVHSGIAQDWVRVGDANRVKRDLYKDLDGVNFVQAGFKDEESQYKLIGSTLHKLAFNSSSAPKFDLLIVDEAGQVPVFFWPIIQRLTKRLVLVGDQFQLPPVLNSKQSQLPFDNIFSMFIDDDTPMLETQYRMRREIQAWSSEKFYRGKLRPHNSVATRDYFSDNPAFLIDGFVVSKKFGSDSIGKCSQMEADFITDKLEKLIKTREDFNTVGVICPYRAQAGIVNASLQSRFGVAAASRILVDTVERFQGQEREAIFLSLGTSGASKEDLRFLSDPRRLNVSITRAKSRFFCLFDERLIERSKGKQSEDLNEFLRWITTGQAKIRRAA